MSPQKSHPRSAALLFEKLTDLAPGNPEDSRDAIAQTRDALMASIRCELSRILDTRLPWPHPQGSTATEGIPASVIAYGIPDLTHLCLRKPADRIAIERLIREAIATFEPRLMTPQVRIMASPAQDRAHLDITGVMQFRQALEPLSFRIETNLRMSDSGKRGQ